MAKLTPEVNLFRCQRTLPTTAQDLVDNFPLAKKLALTATKIFWIKTGAASFSGYTYPEGRAFSIQLWHEERLYRIVRFPNLGYSGVLHVELNTNTIGDAIGCDFLGDLYQTQRCLETTVEGPNTVPKPKTNRKPPKLHLRRFRTAATQHLIVYLESE